MPLPTSRSPIASTSCRLFLGFFFDPSFFGAAVSEVANTSTRKVAAVRTVIESLRFPLSA